MELADDALDLPIDGAIDPSVAQELNFAAPKPPGKMMASKSSTRAVRAWMLPRDAG